MHWVCSFKKPSASISSQQFPQLGVHSRMHVQKSSFALPYTHEGVSDPTAMPGFIFRQVGVTTLQ